MNMVLMLSLVAQTQAITVHEAVNVALAKHPVIELTEAYAARGDNLVREAKAARMPQLSMESSVTRFEEPMVVAPLHGFDPRNPPVFDRTLTQGALTLGYTLLDPSRGNRIERAEALASASVAQALSARAQTIAETVRAYLHVWAARERNQAQVRRVAAIDLETSRARQLVDAGRGARVVLLRAEMAKAAADAEAATVVSDLESAQHELADLLELPASTIASADIARLRLRDANVPDRAQIIETAQRNNAELRRLRLQRAAAESDRNAARGSRLPRLQLAGRFVEYASNSSSPQGEWQGGAQLSYPIYTGGARGATIDRASADLRAADAELALGERRVAEAADRAIAALKAARARTRALETAADRAEAVARIEQLSLDAGAGVQSDYFLAVAEQFRARAALADARMAEVIAVTELARITGELNEQWLAVHVEAVR